MAKKKMKMYQTLKINIFGKIAVNGIEIPTTSIKTGHLVVNSEYCDLRTIMERYNPETKELAPSAVDSISCSESVLARHYGKHAVTVTVAAESDKAQEYNSLYDFITVACSDENEADPETTSVKERLCLDGLYLPLSGLTAVGYVPHDETEIVEISGTEYVRYRAAMQSASENRQCKLTMTTYGWDKFAKTVSGDALYLYEPTQTAQKAIARQGLGKTNGNVVEDFYFSYAIVPDLETEITFSARCFDDKENTITEQTVTAKKAATDGCGFISLDKALELTDKLGMSHLPSAFQVRYGQVKGILLVFDFHKYTAGIIKEDILFTQSMWKSDFDVSKAQFLVANVSKAPRRYTEWNYQMLTTLNSNLCFDDMMPYVQDIKVHMEKALSTPEAALKFLGILSDISDLDSDNDSGSYDCVDKVSAVIRANPQLAMNIRWVKQSIKRKIDLVCKKMLSGKIPMPQSNVSIMAPDPLAFFNRLCINDNGTYNFSSGNPVVQIHRQARELAAHEFRCGDYEGELLATRNPLTHHAQIRKLQCVNHESSAYWYRFINQVTIFNAHDETVLGMGGADHDGDICITTKLFTDKFKQADYIIYNANDTGDKSEKVILTEDVAQLGILANLQQNMLGIICNINTRCLELMNDSAALRKFVLLASYADDRSFGIKEIPQMPYKPKFHDEQTAREYLETLNHQLTTLSELEVDRPKTGYVNRFYSNQQEYALPFIPYWFANIKGQLNKYSRRPSEVCYDNRFGEPVRSLTRNYQDGKVVKTITDTLKTKHAGSENWVQRTIEMMSDGESIMASLQKFVQEQILDMEIDGNSCFSILESLKAASILEMSEVVRIMESVRRVYRKYCCNIAGNLKAMRDGHISQDDFSNALEHIINISDDALRAISSDRIALAYAAYALSLENGYGSQSFPFLIVLDGMVALLENVKTMDFYEINLHSKLPQPLVPTHSHLLESASHVIVYNRKCRLPESIDQSKTYFGDVALPNGSYEIHRDLKGRISLIIPKSVPKDRLNILPYNDNAEFSLKVSYKASELCPEHQNGTYVTDLMANNAVTFKEATISGNAQYCVYVGDTWVGTIFDDKSNGWVMRKEIVMTLLGNEYALKSVPSTGTKTNANSFITSTGKPRTAQILSFAKQAKPVEQRLPFAKTIKAAIVV